METLRRNIFLTVHKTNHLKSCVKYLQSLSWPQLCWLWFLRLNQRIQTRLYALLGIRSTLTVSINELFKSKRFCVGIVLIVVGVLSKHLYLAFDPNALFDEWVYYKNTYWYLWTIRLQMKDVIFSIGVFLIFPTKFKLRYIVLLNMFSATTEIIHYSFYTVDYKTFHMPATWTVQTIGIFLPVFLVKIADYMVYRKYHLKHGSIARIFGIAKSPGVSAEQKLEIINKEEEVIHNLYAKY